MIGVCWGLFDGSEEGGDKHRLSCGGGLGCWVNTSVMTRGQVVLFWCRGAVMLCRTEADYGGRQVFD